MNHGYLDSDKLTHLIRLIADIDCAYCVLSHAPPLTKKELLDYLETLLTE